MTRIETKYDIGEKVWFMRENAATSGNIDSIRTYRNGYKQYDSNAYGFKGITENYLERDLFRSKEELLNSL